MTIRKRLFISNILMIIIPILISIGTMFIAFAIYNGMSQGELYEMLKENRNDDAILDSASAALKTQWVLITLLAFVIIVFLIILTNRLLTKHIFNKIEQPLEMLSDGVHQIKNGNLNHRITYNTEDEFQPICEDFNEMAVRLKASVEESLKNEQNRKELITGISHDIRSPLTSIKAFVEGLMDGVAATPETQREYLQIIKAKTDDINNMVSQLFLFSKMDMGNYPANPEKLDIGKEISDFVAALREDYKARGLFIELKDLPQETFIYADPIQLRSVFTNLLDNSAKYKDKETVEADIACEAGTDVVRILFSDNGPGVPPETIPKLFDLFYRGDLSRNNPNQGSGLGLAIVSKALERMNGRITVENRVEGGLRIMIEVPRMKKEKPE